MIVFVIKIVVALVMMILVVIVYILTVVIMDYGYWMIVTMMIHISHLILCDNSFKLRKNFNFHDRYVIALSITKSS